MEAAEGTAEGDEIARLCVNKLRAMLVVEGDPNLRYVALLAFVKITNSHADLVSQHQDVILECIDDPDISIRTRALDLVSGMVNGNNLQPVVERLLKQLRSAGKATPVQESSNDRSTHDGIIPMADDDEDDATITIRPKEPKSTQAPPLPDDYRALVIERTLEMCSKDTYANMNDFEWYIGVLVELVKQCPAAPSPSLSTSSQTISAGKQPNIADRIGLELLNVAVRVKAVRPEATSAAQSLLMHDTREELFPTSASGGQGVLASAAFIAGEYADLLSNPDVLITSLTHPSSHQLPASVLTSYLQAIPKVFVRLTKDLQTWDQPTQSNIALITARITHFFEPLTLHPNLEVQERAVEYLDLLRLASEAAANHQAGPDAEVPLLLNQAIPTLFSGAELNPVAPAAIHKVPKPETLDLDVPINSSLSMILSQADYDSEYADDDNEVYRLYHEKPSAITTDYQRPAAELLEAPDHSRSSSYQDTSSGEVDTDVLERKKAERRERYKDDPYYIDSERASGASTPMHSILRNANGQELNVDDIPVMELKLDSRDVASDPERARAAKPIRKPKRHFEIAADETLDGDELSTSLPSNVTKPGNTRVKKSLLQLDSSGLSSLSLDENASGRAGTQLEFERRQADEEEMANAMKEVQRLRLEMQRQQERIEQHDAPEDGTFVKRKKKKKARVGLLDDGPTGEPMDDEGATAIKKKKKKKKKAEEGEPLPEEEQPVDAIEEATGPAKVKRKKKRQVVFDENTAVG